MLALWLCSNPCVTQQALAPLTVGLPGAPKRALAAASALLCSLGVVAPSLGRYEAHSSPRAPRATS